MNFVISNLSAILVIAAVVAILVVAYRCVKRRRCWPLDEHAKYYEDRS